MSNIIVSRIHTLVLWVLKNGHGLGSIDKRRRVIHGVKVGVALILVSLLYMINPMFEQVGENAMWAIMTVVVMFEFYAGGTLGKGINRGIGTIVGGGMGCVVAIQANDIDNVIGKRILIAFSLFVFGCGATYCRLMPRIKKRCEYGMMISILTFNLVAVSGVHDPNSIVELALDRLATIAMGFAVCVSVSLFVFPIWAGDQLHCSTATHFHTLANSLQGCLNEYLKVEDGKVIGDQGLGDFEQDCKLILSSKSNDETLAHLAKCEPWHGKFGLQHPWDKYLEIGQHLRELTSIILSLNRCLQSPKQPSRRQREALYKDPCENLISSMGWILKELGEGIDKMEVRRGKLFSMGPKLKAVKLQLLSTSELKMEIAVESDENLVIGGLNFMLVEIVERVEKLVETVQELGEAANFRPRENFDV